MTTLSEYFDQFARLLDVSPGYGMTAQVAAEVAAGYHIGLSPEQMQRFLARRTEITSVAVALAGPKLSVEAIERILEARRDGAIYPKEVLARAFMPEEVHEKFRSEVFSKEASNPSFKRTPDGAA